MNERRFWQAHEQHYRIPDEPESEECTTCEGCGYVKEDETDDNENPEECPDCDGLGEVPAKEVDFSDYYDDRE